MMGVDEYVQIRFVSYLTHTRDEAEMAKENLWELKLEETKESSKRAMQSDMPPGIV